MLAPGRADDPSQFIDVRDLAELMVRLLEQKRSGLFNAAGPEKPITAGLAFRPLADTVRDTLAWWPSVPEA